MFRFVTVVTCNCQFLYIYLSKLLHGCVKVVDWFVKVLICISRPLPNKIKLKFDQNFEAAFGLFCLWQYFLTPFLIVLVLVSLFTPTPKSWIAAPDMRHVQSLLLPPAQVFIYTSKSFAVKLLFHANSNMSGSSGSGRPNSGPDWAVSLLHFFGIIRWNILNIFSIS